MPNKLPLIILFLCMLALSQKGSSESSLNKDLSLEEFQKKIISIGCKSPKVSHLKPLSMGTADYIAWYSGFGMKSKLSVIAKCKAQDGLFYKTLFEEELFANDEDAKKRLPKIKELPDKENGKSDFAVTILLREGFRIDNRVYTLGTFVYKNALDGDLLGWRSAFEKKLNGY